jgi:hypothetical protein
VIVCMISWVLRHVVHYTVDVSEERLLLVGFLFNLFFGHQKYDDKFS